MTWNVLWKWRWRWTYKTDRNGWAELGLLNAASCAPAAASVVRNSWRNCSTIARVLISPEDNSALPGRCWTTLSANQYMRGADERCRSWIAEAPGGRSQRPLRGRVQPMAGAVSARGNGPCSCCRNGSNGSSASYPSHRVSSHRKRAPAESPSRRSNSSARAFGGRLNTLP
jgi:hypothetical protein